MDDRELGGDARVAQVRVELVELHRGEHALVDHHPCGQRGEVGPRGVLDPAAHGEGRTLQLEAGARPGPVDRSGHACRAVRTCCVCQEDLHEVGADRFGGGADETVGDGHLAQSEQLQALVGRDRPESVQRLCSAGRITGQEGGAGRVGTEGRQLEPDDLAEEGIGQLHHDPGAVAGVLLGADGSAVLEVAQRRERVLDDVVPGATAQGRDHRDAAGVDLAVGVVEALGRREVREPGGPDGVRRAQIVGGVRGAGGQNGIRIERSHGSEALPGGRPVAGGVGYRRLPGRRPGIHLAICIARGPGWPTVRVRDPHPWTEASRTSRPRPHRDRCPRSGRTARTSRRRRRPLPRGAACAE